MGSQRSPLASSSVGWHGQWHFGDPIVGLMRHGSQLARELLVGGELNGGGSEDDMGSCLGSISRSPPPFYVHRYPAVAAVNVCTFWRTLLAGDSADGLHSPQG